MEKFQKQLPKSQLISTNDFRLWLGSFLFILGSFIFGYVLEQGITLAFVPMTVSVFSIAMASLGMVLFFRSEW